MQNSFAVGDIVEVPATYSDDSDDEAARETPWSVVEFGTAGKSAMCKGTIQAKKSKEVWSVRFTDGTFNIHFSWMSSAGLPEVPEAQKQKKRTWQEVDGEIELSNESSEEEEMHCNAVGSVQPMLMQCQICSYIQRGGNAISLQRWNVQIQVLKQVGRGKLHSLRNRR